MFGTTLTMTTMFLMVVIISLLIQVKAMGKETQDESASSTIPYETNNPILTKGTTNMLDTSPGLHMDIPSLTPSFTRPPAHVKQPFSCQWQS